MTKKTALKKVLFLCTGNSCRSQMAEGWANHLLGEKFQFFSAGIKKYGLNHRAVQVMKEAGVDISHHISKTTDEIPQASIDYVITVCGHAHETCPHFPVGKIIHHSFDDPPHLTRDMDNEEEILQVYRHVRDEIKIFISNLENHLNS